MIPLYQPSQKKLPGGQQGKGREVVLHDQGEDYQQPKTWKFNQLSTLGYQGGVPIPNFKLGPKSHRLVRKYHSLGLT